MSDFENSRDERSRRRQERRDAAMQRYGRHGHVWTGLFILLIGIGALLKVSITDLPHWLFGWQMLLIVLGFFVGIRERFRGGGWFIMMLVGGTFLVTEIIPDLNVRRYIWPMALIVVGIFFIFRPRRRDWNWRDHVDAKTKDDLGGQSWRDEKYSSEDFVDSTSIFGGANKIILSKDFRGGDIVNIFGGTELNLSQADIQEKAVLEMTTIFGGTKLIVPSNWSVKSEATIVFGGIEDKRSMIPATGTLTKVLVLKGTVIFGGIEIKSF